MTYRVNQQPTTSIRFVKPMGAFASGIVRSARVVPSTTKSASGTKAFSMK